MKYVVTGANGMVGKALTLQLAREGHEVTAIYRSQWPEEFIEYENISPAKGDIQDKDFLEKSFVGLDGVFHVAAFAKPWTQDKSTYYNINEIGTKNVAEACVKNGVKRLVYTSSAGIHGAQQNGNLIDESTWPVEYFTDYEQSKFNGRNEALSFMSDQLEVVIVSPARVYAPGKVSESNVPARMISIYLNKKVGVAAASGKGIGSYAFIDDIVHGHILAMTKGVSGEEYLLGGDNKNYIEFFGILAELTGKKYPILKVPYQLSLLIGKTQLFLAETMGVQPMITTPWVRKYLKDWGVNSEKIKLIGYNPISLREGMKRILAHSNAK
jgi:NAD+-dependent farnesol dehydrogenase